MIQRNQFCKTNKITGEGLKKSERGENMITVNFQSRTPVYQQLYDDVIRLVSVGAISEDSKLPTVRSLATELGVNPNTVAKAYKMLESDGYIYSVVGRGSFISGKLSKEGAGKMKAMEELEVSVKSAIKKGVTKDEIYSIINKVVEGNKEEVKNND